MWPRRKRWSLMGGGRSYLASDRVTPKYDIDIQQHGKPRKDIMKAVPSGGSGHHPGFESGYMGGIYNKDWIQEVVRPDLTPYNKNPTINAAMASQASQTPTAPFGGGIGKSAYQGVGSKKKSNKLKYIVEALQEMEGAEPPKLSGGKFGRAMPAPLGFSLASMGGRLGEQEAMAKARREEELRRRMKLMGGGY